MIFYHWSINYVASKFHLIKIIIFHWRRNNETINVPALKFSIDPVAWVMVWWLPQYGKWWNRGVVWAVVWRKMCQMHAMTWVQICFHFYFWVTMNNWMWLEVPESPKTAPSTGPIQIVGLSYTYHDDRWAVLTRISWSVCPFLTY